MTTEGPTRSAGPRRQPFESGPVRRERDGLRFASGSDDSPANPLGPLVLVTYRDHVLFKRLDVAGVGPVTRQTIGRIARQDDEMVVIVHDWSIITDDGRRDRASPCGLGLLRALIESIEEVTSHG